MPGSREAGLRRWRGLAGRVAFGAVGVGQPFQGIQDRTRPLVFPRQHGLAGDRAAFEIHVGRELRMKHDAESQAAISAERHAGRLADVPWQGIQFAAENRGDVFAWIWSRPPMVMGSAACALAVASSADELGQSLGQAGNDRRQIAHAAAGDVLFVEVVFLEQGEPLQFGVGLGEGQHGRVA